MNLLKRFVVTLLSVIGFASPVLAVAPQSSPSEAMLELRLRALLAPAKNLGITPTKEFSRTYAVLIDFPINQITATIVALSDGSASLYTTSTFGIIGGMSHDKVRAAAMRLIATSNNFFDEAKPTKEYSYPGQGKVRFYLVSFSGVRMIETDLSAIESNQSKYSELFWLGQEVLTQLRLATEKK